MHGPAVPPTRCRGIDHAPGVVPVRRRSLEVADASLAGSGRPPECGRSGVDRDGRSLLERHGIETDLADRAPLRWKARRRPGRRFRSMVETSPSSVPRRTRSSSTWPSPPVPHLRVRTVDDSAAALLPEETPYVVTLTRQADTVLVAGVAPSDPERRRILARVAGHTSGPRHGRCAGAGSRHAGQDVDRGAQRRDAARRRSCERARHAEGPHRVGGRRGDLERGLRPPEIVRSRAARRIRLRPRRGHAATGGTVPPVRRPRGRPRHAERLRARRGDPVASRRRCVGGGVSSRRPAGRPCLGRTPRLRRRRAGGPRFPRPLRQRSRRPVRPTPLGVGNGRDPGGVEDAQLPPRHFPSGRFVVDVDVGLPWSRHRPDRDPQRDRSHRHRVLPIDGRGGGNPACGGTGRGGRWRRRGDHASRPGSGRVHRRGDLRRPASGARRQRHGRPGRRSHRGVRHCLVQSGDLLELEASIALETPDGFQVENNVQPPVVSPYTWSIERTDDSLVVSGFVPSEAVRVAVRDAADDAAAISP